MRTWTLTGAGGQSYGSAVPGMLGRHRRARIYSRSDCAATRRAIARGGYVRHHTFFLNEVGACDAGYWPYVVCMPQAYAAWKGLAGCG